MCYRVKNMIMSKGIVELKRCNEIKRDTVKGIVVHAGPSPAYPVIDDP